MGHAAFNQLSLCLLLSLPCYSVWHFRVCVNSLLTSLLLGVSEHLHHLTFNNLKLFALFSFQDFLFIFGFMLLDYDMLSRVFSEFVLLGIC